MDRKKITYNPAHDLDNHIDFKKGIDMLNTNCGAFQTTCANWDHRVNNQGVGYEGNIVSTRDCKSSYLLDNEWKANHGNTSLTINKNLSLNAQSALTIDKSLKENNRSVNFDNSWAIQNDGFSQDNHVLDWKSDVEANRSINLGSHSLVNTKTGSKCISSNSIFDNSCQQKIDWCRVSEGPSTIINENLKTNAKIDLGVTSHGTLINFNSSGSLVQTGGVTGKWKDIDEDLSAFDQDVNTHFDDLIKIGHSIRLSSLKKKSQNNLNKFLKTTNRLNARWDELESKYEDYRSLLHQKLHELFGESLFEYFSFEQLVDPLQNKFNRVKNKFSRLIRFTNKISKLIFDSIFLENQRLEFRKIFGFHFKNLDDESHSDIIVKGTRKQPKIAFINQTSNITMISTNNEQTRINFSIKKTFRKSG